MNCHRLILSLLLVGLTLTAAPVGAFDDAPDLRAAEKAALILIQAVNAAAAAVVEHQSCAATKGFYDLSVETFYDGSGVAVLDNLMLYVSQSSSTNKGQLYQVTSSGVGDVDNVVVSDFFGLYGSDLTGAMMYGNTDLSVGGVPYDEHLILDGWVTNNPVPSWGNVKIMIKEGLETITKVDYPRAKWTQRVEYRRPDALDGRLYITKTQVAPNSAMDCVFRFSALVDDFGWGFQTLDGQLVIFTTK